MNKNDMTASIQTNNLLILNTYIFLNIITLNIYCSEELDEPQKHASDFGGETCS